MFSIKAILINLYLNVPLTYLLPKYIAAYVRIHTTWYVTRELCKIRANFSPQ